MILYLDTSTIVPLFTADALNAKADALIKNLKPSVVLSNFAAVEFASAISRRVRTGELTKSEALVSFAEFDMWAAAKTERVELTSADVISANGAFRRLDLTLRTGDAIHISIAQRHRAALATFDVKMAAAARTLGVETYEN